MKAIAVSPRCAVRLDLDAATREDVLRAMVEDMRDAGYLKDVDGPYRSLLEREGVQTTAIGEGIALPHARTQFCDEPRFAAARLANAIDYDAPDSIPVDLVFVVFGPPEAPAEHIRMIARIARVVQSPAVAASLRDARSEDEFRDVLERCL